MRIGSPDSAQIGKHRQFFGPFLCEKKGNQSKHSKGTIYHAPSEWNPARCAEGQRPRNDQHTGNQAEIEQPDVSHRIPQDADESDRDHEMSKRQPVEPVHEKRKSGVGLAQSFPHAQKPVHHARLRRVGTGIGYAEKSQDEIHFPFERDRSQAAADQAEDEYPRQDLDPAAKNSFTIHNKQPGLIDNGLTLQPSLPNEQIASVKSGLKFRSSSCDQSS